MLIYKLAHLCLCYCVLKFPLDFVNVLSFWLNRFFVVVFWFPFSPEEEPSSVQLRKFTQIVTRCKVRNKTWPLAFVTELTPTPALLFCGAPADIRLYRRQTGREAIKKDTEYTSRGKRADAIKWNEQTDKWPCTLNTRDRRDKKRAHKTETKSLK